MDEEMKVYRLALSYMTKEELIDMVCKLTQCNTAISDSCQAMANKAIENNSLLK